MTFYCILLRKGIYWQQVSMQIKLKKEKKSEKNWTDMIINRIQGAQNIWYTEQKPSATAVRMKLKQWASLNDYFLIFCINLNDK